MAGFCFLGYPVCEQTHTIHFQGRGDPLLDEQRKQVTTRLASYSTVINVILTLLKGVVGFLARSDALVADAAHSAADVAGSVAVMIGLRVARLPADTDHPYGHGKAEVIAASIVAIFLILAGLDVIFNSVRQFFSPLSAPAPVALYTAVFSMIVKEAIYRYQIKIGRAIRSPALIAGATDHRSDVYSSLAASAGILISLLGKNLHQPFLLYADPIAGLIVAAVVVRIGYQMAVDSFRSLLDQVLDSETTQNMTLAVQGVSGVMRVDDLRARSNGSYWIVDVKMSVDPSMSVLDGHHIAKTVKWTIMDQYEEVFDVLVHVNPFFEMDRE